MNDTTALDEQGLEDVLSEPTDPTREVLAALTGDIVVLGAGGKMGPTLAMMLAKAAPGRNIYAVSRFSDKAAKARIEQAGIQTIEVDLLDASQYSNLPNAENVFFLAGMKFGSGGNQPLTWAMNSFLPALVARPLQDAPRTISARRGAQADRERGGGGGGTGVLRRVDPLLRTGGKNSLGGL